jgi:hypothetical protein
LRLPKDGSPREKKIIFRHCFGKGNLY